MYESPIQITNIGEQIAEDITKKEEDYIFSVVKMYVDVDKDELIKALAYDRGQYEKGYADGRADRDAEIVRCKECKYYNHQHHYCEGIGYWFGEEDAWSDNGFCYKGERRE